MSDRINSLSIFNNPILFTSNIPPKSWLIKINHKVIITIDVDHDVYNRAQSWTYVHNFNVIMARMKKKKKKIYNF